MSCSQIATEINQVTDIKKDIEGKRGLSGRNVGMALVFWPGILVNEMNGSEAAKLANERIANCEFESALCPQRLSKIVLSNQTKASD